MSIFGNDVTHLGHDSPKKRQKKPVKKLKSYRELKILSPRANYEID